MPELEFFVADPPAKCSTDKMWLTEVESVLDYCVGRGLDVGSGNRTIRPDMVRLDSNPANAPDICGQADRVPEPAGSFDFVFSAHVIEHLHHPKRAIAEWIRVTKPGGYVCIVVPNTIYTMGQNTDPSPHVYEWTPLSFMEDVLGLSIPWNRAWFELELPVFLHEFAAELVFTDEACPSWSFAVVLRKAVNGTALVADEVTWDEV